MGYDGEVRANKDQILDVREEEARREGRAAHAVTRIGSILTRPWFFLSALALHVAWVLVNVPAISPIEPFDPPPFMLLATIASAEAPLLALLILMRQQQDRRVAELREDVSLQTSLHTEREISKLLEMMEGVQHALGIAREDDPELEDMRTPLDAERLLERLESRMEEDEDEPGNE